MPTDRRVPKGDEKDGISHPARKDVENLPRPAGAVRGHSSCRGRVSSTLARGVHRGVTGTTFLVVWGRGFIKTTELWGTLGIV